ncbi:hypothetical protein VN97_g6207 [Penicillium thymicola]|uniref:Uncharacterized protein n=1 Tax=Penicillium thymicola TaxID=293382 RepID=A0AAI9THD1_PENTH|nr:hypothetical protein VN97_g6207 [Penicillium thymicola]
MIPGGAVNNTPRSCRDIQQTSEIGRTVLSNNSLTRASQLFLVLNISFDGLSSHTVGKHFYSNAQVFDISLGTPDTPGQEANAKGTPIDAVSVEGSLPYKDSSTPKLAAKRSANFLQIQVRFNSDSLQIQFTPKKLFCKYAIRLVEVALNWLSATSNVSKAEIDEMRETLQQSKKAAARDHKLPRVAVGDLTQEEVETLFGLKKLTPKKTSSQTISGTWSPMTRAFSLDQMAIKIRRLFARRQQQDGDAVPRAPDSPSPGG